MKIKYVILRVIDKRGTTEYVIDPETEEPYYFDSTAAAHKFIEEHRIGGSLSVNQVEIRTNGRSDGH